MIIKKIFLVLSAVMLICPQTAFAEKQKTIPYFVSLKHDEVNLRTGPGTQFPIIWVYKQKAYPMEVIDTHELWRQVRDVDGTVGWMHHTMLRDKRFVLVKKEEKLKDKPFVLARPVAVVQTGTIGRVYACPENSEYCFLEFEQDGIIVKGWLNKMFFYGVFPDEEISD